MIRPYAKYRRSRYLEWAAGAVAIGSVCALIYVTVMGFLHGWLAHL